ncbi:asparagine synthetase B [Candidatus Thorarchaeota archaeon]|nr:MAG: asparagine synthetase B [Candidatus Thorarchaeota archaeon]
MAGIVGTLLRDRNIAQSFHDRMLKRLSHRGSPTTMMSENPQCVALITQFSRRRRRKGCKDRQDTTLAVDSGGIVLDGEDTSMISESVAQSDVSSLQAIAAAGVVREGVRVIRSTDGTRPVYYAPLEQGFAFAPERKAIWALPTAFVRPVEPGEAVTFLWNGSSRSQEQHGRTRPPIDNEASEAELILMLQKELEESFSRLESTKKCAVLFSGGVDSALAALLTSKSCGNTVLITAATGAAKDSRVAESGAKLLGLEHHLVHLNPDSVWKAIPEVIYAIESTNRMDVEIAIPFFLAAGEARKKKCRIVVSGQGPDELFAGYAKHERILAERGPDALRGKLWEELSVTHETNIARDERAIASQKLTGFFPYLHRGFVQASLRVPTEMLIRLEGRMKRKLIFRRLAKKMGLPTRLCSRRKAATQYSSGSAKVLLQSIRANVEEAKRVTKKKAEPLVQDVLDFIGNEIGVPTQYGFIGEFNLDLGPTTRLLKRIN